MGGRGYGRVAAVTIPDETRRILFEAWCNRNPGAWNYIVGTALEYWRRGLKRISTKFLVEKCRYDYPHKTYGIPFLDANGNTHVYNINNNDTAVMARVLLEEYPDMPIETRRHA